MLGILGIGLKEKAQAQDFPTVNSVCQAASRINPDALHTYRAATERMQ